MKLTAVLSRVSAFDFVLLFAGRSRDLVAFTITERGLGVAAAAEGVCDICRDDVLRRVEIVDDEDDCVRTAVVRRPYLAQLVLAAEVPDLEADVPVRHLLHVAAHRWLRGYDVAQVSAMR